MAGITAQTVIDRIRRQCGPGWRDGGVDGFLTGGGGDSVTGIATTYAPSLDVLHKAVAARRNLILSLESPFWTRPEALLPGGTEPGGLQDGPPGYRPAPGATIPGVLPPLTDANPLYREKRDYIAANRLTIYRFIENWTARQPAPQVEALVRAVGWSKGYTAPVGVPWATRGAAFVTLPPATLRDVARHLKKTLRIGAIRIVGDPETPVRKAAVAPGIALLADLQRYFAEPGVDLVVMGEAIWENEGMQYVADVIASGRRKGLILLGQEASQEPGCGLMAEWLRGFVSEVPVTWIPAGDPSWMPA